MFCAGNFKFNGANMPVVRPNPKQIEKAIVSNPGSGEYRIKKIRLASNAQDIRVTYSSAAEA